MSDDQYKIVLGAGVRPSRDLATFCRESLDAARELAVAWCALRQGNRAGIYRRREEYKFKKKDGSGPGNEITYPITLAFWRDARGIMCSDHEHREYGREVVHEAILKCGASRASKLQDQLREVDGQMKVEINLLPEGDRAWR